MKKRKHRVSAYHRIMILSACLLAGLSSSCSDDIEKDDGGSTGNEGTGKITLPVNLTFTPITETKAVTRPVKPGSELAKAGFDYELEVTSCTTPDTLSAPDTKAVPTQLKNVVALLFGETTGAYKGKAKVSGPINAGSDLLLDFTVNNTTDTSYRLVVVANDNAATAYTSSSDLSTFEDTYAKFLEVKLVKTTSKDEDVPYVGSITGINMEGVSGTLVLPLYWMLAKVTVNVNNFAIKDGPDFESIRLMNGGYNYLGTRNAYNGSGILSTPVENIANYPAVGSKKYTYYVGENIQSYPSVTSITDRCPGKAPNATYIRLVTSRSDNTNTSPAIGEEYITSGGVVFQYYIYLGDGSVSDFSVRRNTKYNITINIDGTLEGQRRQALTDKRIEVVSTETHAGLNIGKFGGLNSAEFTTGTVDANTITGYYTKDLLLEPNTSRSTVIDNQTRIWSNNTSLLQTEARKIWDPTYTLTSIDKTNGLAYDYCKTLTLGGVAEGTWYLPTQAQLAAIWTVLKGLKNNAVYANYSAVNPDRYWCSTEYDNRAVWTLNFANGYVQSNLNGNLKSYPANIRCVRDL
ncbi:DUF4906 domain-containing protein [Parabacteroides sp.]